MSDRSLEDIDIAKLLIYITVFLIVSIVMIFAFIVPNIKDYQQISAEHSSQISALTKISKNFQNTLDELRDIEKLNEFTLKSINNKFDEKLFIVFATQFFQNVLLSKISSENSDFYRYELNVSTSMNTPTKFYEFLDALKRFENVVKIDFPITMRAQNGIINTTFNVRIYGTK